ncbi:TPA: hypothetical protein ACH3X2_011772 [Trebouxia sp. C0005]
MHSCPHAAEMQGKEKFLRYALDVGHDQHLQVVSDPDNILGQHIGNGIWTSAHELVCFLRIQHPFVLRHQRVLELGAGLGLAGQAAALSGANVILSDTAEMMQLMQINTQANKQMLLDCPGSLQAMCVLQWGCCLSNYPYGPAKLQPDLILGSDITYDPAQFLPLLQTIAAYAVIKHDVQVILAMPDREETSAFLETASKHGFVWRCLRQVQKPDLLTPILIYQLVLGPKPSQDVLQLQVSPCPSSVTIPWTDGPVSAAAALVSEAGQHGSGFTAASQPSPLSNAGADEGTPGESSSVLGARRPGTIASPGQLLVQSGTGSSPASYPSPGTVSPPQSMLGDDNPAAYPPLGRVLPYVLLVLDFDWSVIEENSDTFVVHELGGWESFQRLKAQGLPWTELMDAAMVAVHSQQGRRAADIKAACVRVPMHPRMHEVLQEASASSNVHMVIVSDANTVFIDYILQAQGLQGCFNAIITNPARFVDKALRISPYHTQPHGCAACPPNLCKGLVIEELLLQHNYCQIVYLGDGRGDYCPCTRLGPNDHILARQNYPDGTECSLLQLLTEQGVPSKDCRQRLSPSHMPVGDDSLAAGLTGEASKQETEAFANTTETSDVSFAKSGQQQQQTDAADVDGARCQGTHAADDQSLETEQQSRLSSLPLGDKTKHSLQWQHASVYSWSAAVDAANLIQLLLKAPTQT